jgi:alpha/beta superfamily hydrolase
MELVETRECVTLENQGEKIFGVLHRPLQLTKVPAIIVCPGFAGNKCGKFRVFVTLAKELAKAGIMVFRFDYRGSGDSEGEFQDITLEGKTSDTLKCLDFLANDPQVDNTRLGILGRSLGGAIAIVAARRFEKIKSLALWAPVFNSDPWKNLWESLRSDPKVDLTKEDILKNLPLNMPNLEFLKQFFHLDLQRELAGLTHIPLLHVHGVQDQIVNIDHAKEYETARSGLDNSKFIQLQKSDHDFSDPADKALAIQETCQWYKRTL